ncbi:acetylcholine receptor subunit beta-like [Physella acuta]|uniref:acetylcholine receptor subunit beta-like n=1 Tax=Physella acuta TaxID=109671 RepID=UPI0027DE0ECA|nr:acetylcholine receptor subunit beta-like [Physella acuta]
MLALMSPVPFFLSPEEPEKLMVALSLLLSFTVFIDFIEGKLPQNSDNISFLVIYLAALFIQAFLGVIGNTIVLILNAHDTPKPKPKPIRGDHAPAHTTTAHHTTNLSVTKNSTPNNSDCLGFEPQEQTTPGAAPSSRAYKMNKCFLALNTTVLLLSSFLAWFFILY